jgi:spore maturation protein CgeB
MIQKPKHNIAILCLTGQNAFLVDIAEHLKKNHNVIVCVSHNKDEIAAAISNADIVWIEWANELAITLTNDPQILDNKHVICRLHSYEAFAGFVKRINWKTVSDLIFVAPHIKQVTLLQDGRISRMVKNIHVVHNGINMDKFVFKERDKGFNIAYVGSINYKKSPMLLLHAFHALVQKDSRYKLHVAGEIQDDRYKLYFTQMIDEMGLAGNIQMDGRINDVAGWLNDKHYIVCTSVLEGHPVGIMEAMASGLKPVIHNFVGARNFYPPEYIWNTIPEFVEMVANQNYEATEYRNFIKTNYSLDKQLDAIDNILDNIEITPRQDQAATKNVNSCDDVTAVIAVRNGVDTIDRALFSLMCQTVPLKKIIVVDDDSTDDTIKMVEDYAAKSIIKIQVIKLAFNHFTYKARNIGAEHVDTDFMFFLDADDFVSQSYVGNLLSVLEENPDCAFAYSDMTYFNETQQSNQFLPDFNVPQLAKQNYVPYCALMRTNDFTSHGGYSNYLNDSRNSMAEWDLWLRLAGDGRMGKRLPRRLFFYNQNNDQMSANYERSWADKGVQMVFNSGASIQAVCGNDHARSMLVCKGRDYLDGAKFGGEVYTWLKPLEAFGEVVTFFYDVEAEHFGEDGMLARLKALADEIKPVFIFHSAFKEHIPLSCWEELSKKFVTIAWFSDDNWRFESYAKRYSQGFSYAVTTHPKSYDEYKAAGLDNVLLSQWAANPAYFKDYGLPKDIDVSFCGQKYGDRADFLEGSQVQTFGKGWPSGMLDFPSMAKIINRSKISVNLTKGANGELQMKMRPFEIAASKTMPLCEYVEGIEQYYEPGKEIVTFKTAEEMREKIDYYLHHDAEREQIAKAAYDRTLRDHTWHNRLEPILKRVGVVSEL